MIKIKMKISALLALLILAMAAPLAASRVIRSGSLREPDRIDPAQVWDDTSSFYVCNIFDTPLGHVLFRDVTKESK